MNGSSLRQSKALLPDKRLRKHGYRPGIMERDRGADRVEDVQVRCRPTFMHQSLSEMKSKGVW